MVKPLRMMLVISLVSMYANLASMIDRRNLIGNLIRNVKNTFS